jgi:hypothetical protein
MLPSLSLIIGGEIIFVQLVICITLMANERAGIAPRRMRVPAGMFFVGARR